jgi:hypothetical protein
LSVARPIEHAHFLAILFAEQRHGAGGNGVVGCHQAGGDRLVGADFRVHFGLDRGNVVRAERGGMREVEPQAIGRDQRALLRDMRAQAVAQRLVQQVRGRMVGAGGIAAHHVHHQLHRVAHLDRAGFDHGLMRMETAQRLGGVGHGQLEAIGPGDRAGIAHLAAAFAIERGLVGQHRDAVTGLCGRHFGAVLDQGHDHAFAAGGGVAGELGGAFALGNVEPHFARRGFARTLPCGAGGGLLLRHGGVEAFAIDAHAAGAQGVFGQVVRKPYVS